MKYFKINIVAIVLCKCLLFTSCKIESPLYLHGKNKSLAFEAREQEKGRYVKFKDGTESKLKRVNFPEDRIGGFLSSGSDVKTGNIILGKCKLFLGNGTRKKPNVNEITELQTKKAYYKLIDGYLARRLVKGKINLFRGKVYQFNKSSSMVYKEVDRSGNVTSTNNIPGSNYVQGETSLFFQKQDDDTILKYQYLPESSFLNNFKEWLKGNKAALELLEKYRKKYGVKKKHLIEIIKVYNSTS